MHRLNAKIRLTMLLSGFELYSRWVPLLRCLTWMVKLMLRGIWVGEYILHCFVIVISYCFSPAQSKQPPTFQAVNNNEGLCNIFP